MTLSIVADTYSPDSLPGITKSSRGSCDIYSGTAEALIAASIIASEQLELQKGRAPGVTVFLAHGEPCPPRLRAWREPGYKAIRQQDDGTYRVEVTASKEVQAWRRKVKKAAEHESEQQRINEALAECRQHYRNWELKHGYSGDANGGSWQNSYEWWEGTKEQLQEVGIGVGLKFPADQGATVYMHCKCPLGFDVRVYLPDSSYAPGKAAARIYTAQSWYVPYVEASKQYVQHAPGVLREVWAFSGWRSRDFYHGSAEAFVTAGLVPSLDLFPGQPGTNKVQASYCKGWIAATSSPRSNFEATIRRRGKSNEFCVELPVTAAEEKRREEACKQHDLEQSERARVLAAERKQLRQGAEPEKTVEEFRSDRAERAEFSLDILWQTVFAKSDGALSFDIPKDSELWEDLAGAFQTIRDAVQEADILRDKKQIAAARTRLKLVAARNDNGLQSMLKNAQHLRLVQSTPKM